MGGVNEFVRITFMEWPESSRKRPLDLFLIIQDSGNYVRRKNRVENRLFLGMTIEIVPNYTTVSMAKLQVKNAIKNLSLALFALFCLFCT